MASAEEWAKIAIEVIEKHAPGYIFGALSTLYGILRLDKMGIDLFGIRARAEKLAAVQKVEIDHANKEIAERDAEIAKLKGGGQG